MPAQSPPNLDDLLNVLNTLTDRNAVRWQTTADEETFRAMLDFGLVRVARDPETSSYLLTLVDRGGVVLEQYEASGEGALLALEILYKKARRQALDLDGRLRHFYDHLKSLAGGL